MSCLECGADFDDMNESQPVCPGCGTAPGAGRDDLDICALLDEAAAIAAAPSQTEASFGVDIDDGPGPTRAPSDLQEALDDADALLLGAGHASFYLPEGFRLFQLPTERIM